MNSLPYKVAASADGAGGFSEVIFDKSVLGFNPSETHGTVQINVQGLDGGTFSVYLKPKGSPSYIEFVTTATAVDGVLVDKKFSFEAVAVTFDGLGAGAAPVVFATFISRSF